jgi:ribosomal protein S18 acetylase RimI-like enzyme
MEFIKVARSDTQLIDQVYNILAAAGAYMVEVFDLHHWEDPYPKESIAQNTESKQVYLVKEGDAYVATFTLSDKTSRAFADKPYADAMYLSKFSVAPGVMKGGVGSACIRYLEQLSKEQGKAKVRLDVYDKSEHAIKFYIKMGYETVGTAPDVLCMEKTL